MALTISAPILHGFSKKSGGTSGFPDFLFMRPGLGINDTFYVTSRDFSEHGADSLNPYIRLSNGALYDPYQGYATPKIDSPETWSVRVVGNVSSLTSFTFAHGLADEIEGSVMGEKLYIFYLYPAIQFSYYIQWRAEGRILRVSYTNDENYLGRSAVVKCTVMKDSSTYQNIGTFNGY